MSRRAEIQVMRKDSSPPMGISLTTYAELETVVDAFAAGNLNLLILVGSHGLGKSRVIREATARRARWIEGTASPFGLYCQLWRHQNRLLVLDDLDDLYASREGVRLLKCLTQTDPIKTVSWHTDAPTLLRDHIPQEFQTTSRVAIITNEWKTATRHVAALQDRGHLVIFAPGALEVHRRTAEWFWDQDIFDFIGTRLHLMREASMRHYLAAWELKQAGMDWRRLVLSRCLSGKALLVAQLKASPDYTSEAHRVRAFMASGGGSRATYFNLAKRLQAHVETAPSIRLTSAPPAPRDPDPDWLRILRKWRGHIGDN